MPNKYAEKKEWNVPKQRYKLSNWSEYSDALRHRGEVEEDVTALNPHRPGRAQLTHPVLHTIRFAYSQRDIDDKLAA